VIMPRAAASTTATKAMAARRLATAMRKLVTILK